MINQFEIQEKIDALNVEIEKLEANKVEFQDVNKNINAILPYLKDAKLHIMI